MKSLAQLKKQLKNAMAAETALRKLLTKTERAMEKAEREVDRISEKYWDAEERVDEIQDQIEQQQIGKLKLPNSKTVKLTQSEMLDIAKALPKFAKRFAC